MLQWRSFNTCLWSVPLLNNLASVRQKTLQSISIAVTTSRFACSRWRHHCCGYYFSFERLPHHQARLNAVTTALVRFWNADLEQEQTYFCNRSVLYNAINKHMFAGCQITEHNAHASRKKHRTSAKRAHLPQFWMRLPQFRCSNRGCGTWVSPQWILNDVDSWRETLILF